MWHPKHHHDGEAGIELTAHGRNDVSLGGVSLEVQSHSGGPTSASGENNDDTTIVRITSADRSAGQLAGSDPVRCVDSPPQD